MKSHSNGSSSSRIATRFVRTVSFAAAHRYASPQLSEEENKKAYGSLYREEGFGHNFQIEAHFDGDVDPLSGMIVNLADVDRWLKDVAARFDHKHLNEIPEFAGAAPTPERLAQKFYELLNVHVEAHRSLPPEKRLGGSGRVHLAKIRVYEGDDLWVDYGA